jgi:hypothetical protein
MQPSGEAVVQLIGLTGFEVKSTNGLGGLVAKDQATRRPCIGDGMLLPSCHAFAALRAYQRVKVDAVSGLLKSGDAPSRENEIAHSNQEIKTTSLIERNTITSHIILHTSAIPDNTHHYIKPPTEATHNVQPEHSQAYQLVRIDAV